MNDLAAAAERVRRHNSGDRTVFMSDPGEIVTMCKRYVDDLYTLADAYIALHPVATAMLDVLIGIDGKAVLPRNLRVMVQQAVADGRKALNPTE